MMSLSPDHYLVLANPSAQSFDHAAAQTYASIVASCGQSVEINDLNAMAFDPVLKDDERFDRGDNRSPWIEAELARLSRCDVVVLIYPIWFGGPPAILKGYVDRVLGAHCGVGAFQSGAAQPALRGRHLLSISTSGTSTEWLREQGQPHAVREGFDLYIERGFGLRGAVGVSDRGHTAVSQLQSGSIDWDGIFGAGVRWFHTGGIFAALSETTAGVVLEATAAARKHGTVVSYDLNYRPSLWRDFGGQQAAREINREIAKSVDVMIGNEEDFAACLGIETPGGDTNLSDLDPENFKAMIGEVTRQFPNLNVVATTLRTAVSASRNHWAAVAWSDDEGFAESAQRMNLEILDRVGGGDSFASGLAYGLLSGRPLAVAVEYGAAHGALAMTTPGDTSMATLREVEAAMAGAGTRIQR